MRKSNSAQKQVYISVPSQIISSISASSLQSLLSASTTNDSSKVSTAKKSRSSKLYSLTKSPKGWIFLLILFGFLGMFKLIFQLDASLRSPCSDNYYPSSSNSLSLLMDNVPGVPQITKQDGMKVLSSSSSLSYQQDRDDEDGDAKEEKLEAVQEFWKQPDGLGYKPCLSFTREYRRWTPHIIQDRTKYLMVVVAGGMNQQRNQIVDAVVIARILGAALVVPILQVNVIWGDESEFSDIFDLEHFKEVLANDVRIVSSLPSTFLRKRPFEESRTPLHASASWIRQHYLGRLKRDNVLLLRGLDSRLSNDLPADLQKLRCKVAFHALKFAPHVLDAGNKIAERMRVKGPYIALHLRLEKDVWVRTGCSPGLTTEFDEMIENERMQHPKLSTTRSSMTPNQRKIAGLCPLNSFEVARLLKALGAPKSAKIYWAGGNPLGGTQALLPLTKEFPHFYNKEDLAMPGELEPYANKSSFLAAIDYIVCEKSDVFMPSHGGNMGHALQGHRAYLGHRKYITPNKRHILPYFLNSSLPEAEFNRIVKEIHQESIGQPELRTTKAARDVTKYPVPDCMCNSSFTS